MALTLRVGAERPENVCQFGEEFSSFCINDLVSALELVLVTLGADEAADLGSWPAGGGGEREQSFLESQAQR